MSANRLPLPLTAFRRKLAVWRQLTLLEKCWFAPTWLLLGIARAAVLTLPFRVLAYSLGQATADHPTTRHQVAVNSNRARRLGRLIRASANNTPWDSNCLAQALVARLLLRLYRIPHAVYFGVIRAPDGGLAAHAWVDAGPVRVTGGRGVERFTVVKVFTDPPATWSR